MPSNNHPKDGSQGWRRSAGGASVPGLRLARPSQLHRIVFAYTVNQLGFWFALVALSLTVYDHTHNSIAVAAVLAVPFIPALFAPVVVARVEASPRRGGLTVLYAIEGTCAIALAAVLWQFSLPAILVLVAIDGSVAYAARALLRSQAALVTEDPGESAAGGAEELPPEAGQAHRANAAINISLALTGVTGPALAGLAVKGIGGPTSMLVDAGCFLVSGVLLVDLRPHVQEAADSVRQRLTVARDFLRTAPGLRAVIATELLALVFFFIVIPVEVGFAKSTLHGGDLGYGALLAAWGAGMVAGSLLFARAHRWLWTMLIAGTLAVGLAYLGFAVAPSLAVACLAAVPGGVGNGVQWAAFLGVVQSQTPERLLGRMMGLVEGASAAAPVLGYALGGILALISPRVAFSVAGVAACLTTLSFARIRASREELSVSEGLAVAAAEQAARQEPGVSGAAP